MEQIGNTLAQLQTQFERRKEENTSCHNMTQHVLNTSLHNVYEMIPKKDYAVLLNQLEAWNVGSPKAVCRIYGVKTVQRAVEYVKGTPNVRCKGAYFTYMVRQLKSEQVEQKTAQVTKQEEPQKEQKQNLPVQSPTRHVKSKKGIFTPPNIINWQEAREFLCKLTDNDLEDEDVLIFAKKLKKQFNFG
ncbi:MAG: hypothetical protein J6Q32_05960 [Clostridia bacterium]|nr:hypothetical protein [Clostridia bacterium]